ncbi:HAMP domain-containing histidine kinase [Deinococcus sp. KNUC1210]|uniref:sensor histidine kinase n=1 Tax=Deinococcus sp. KNUC1210 TaxID=2917691 RepID=UPI001EF0D487|nr:histidine kinase dimerization/phospho-acceptor domain-containing protein [Deinococcus sp. KNUC1210]ULH16601.1 HAMP domain-containing histidine kinase [Deinococcus sp. KNUC1210]
MRPLSLRARLTTLVLGLLLTALLLIGVTLRVRVGQFVAQQADSSTYGQLSLIVQSGQNSGSSGDTYTYQVYQSLIQAAQSAHTWGVLVAGRTAYPTDNSSRTLPPTAVLDAARRSGRAEWQDVRLLSDGRGNLLGLAVERASGRELTLSVIRNYALIALGALLLAGVAVLWLLRLGLRPLRSMALQAARVGAADLSERMPVKPPQDELHLLAVSLNRMLARLEDTFSRLRDEEARTRAFAADASHELRTPLSAIQGSLEVLERVSDDPAAQETRARLMTNLRRESRRAGRLVDDLLTLTRLDAGEALHTAPLDVQALLAGVLDSARDVAPHLTFVLDAPPALMLAANRERLEGAVWNLLRNAAAHTPSGGTVTLRAVPDAQGGALTLSVLNPAQLSPEFLPRMFDRFARGPNAAAGGSGLGLAIVRAVAQAHGGEIFAVQHAELLEVGLRLPLT